MYIIDSTPLEYVEHRDKLVQTTVISYDIQQGKKQMKQSLTAIIIISCLHLKFGYIQLLIMQGIMSYKAFFISKEVRIHLFNASTVSGDLRRSFRIESFFLKEKNQPRIDKESIKRARKSPEITIKHFILQLSFCDSNFLHLLFSLDVFH